MSLEQKVLAYLQAEEGVPPSSAKKFRAFAFGKKPTPEERIAHIKQRINVARTRIETLTHQLQKVKDGDKRKEISQLRMKTEALLKNLKSKLEEVTKFAREFKQGLKGKHAATASVALREDGIKELSKEVAALEALAGNYKRQGQQLMKVKP